MLDQNTTFWEKVEPKIYTESYNVRTYYKFIQRFCDTFGKSTVLPYFCQKYI